MIYTKIGVLRPIVIPKYRNIPVFIIKNNLRSAGMSRERYSNSCASVSKSLPKPPNRLAGKIDPHALHLGVKLERVPAHFAAVTGLLVTAER